MTGRLNGCTIAVLATDGVEQVELMAPVAALREDIVGFDFAEPIVFAGHDFLPMVSSVSLSGGRNKLRRGLLLLRCLGFAILDLRRIGLL